MSSEVEIRLTAVDQATDTINQVASNLQSANSEIADSSSAMSSSLEESNASVQDTALAFNNTATAGMALYMSFDRIENSSVALDRAHVMVEKSTIAVKNAQDAYNKAVAKFGADSPQAQLALEKLKAAQDAHQVALERSDMAQRNYNNTLAFAAMSIIPSLITMITSVQGITEAWTGAQAALNAVMDANPIGIVILAIAGLTAAILALWNYCPPFRDAVLAIANALGGTLSVAAQAITQAFTWFWQNVLQPLGGFIVGVFVANVRILTDVWNALGAAWNAVCSAISGFWNTYIKPIVDFIVGVFIAEIKALMAIWQAAQNAWNALCSGIASIWNTIAAPIVNAIKWFADTINGIFHTLFGWIVGGSVWADLCNGLGTIWNNVVGPLINTISGFANTVVGFFKGAADAIGSIWSGITNTVSGAISTVSNALSGAGTAISGSLSTAANAVGGAMTSVANSVSGGLSTAGSAISNFIGSICYAHALQNAADSSTKTMSSWTDMIKNAMDKGLGLIKDFNAQAQLAGTPTGTSAVQPLSAVAAATSRSSVTLNISAPLVNVEGSADKATVQLAAQSLLTQLKTVIVEPTSAQAPSTMRRIRKGAVM